MLQRLLIGRKRFDVGKMPGRVRAKLTQIRNGLLGLGTVAVMIGELR